MSIVPVLLRRRRLYGSGATPAFSPASLFASGEEGAWYEPSTTTCFTDALGTVAATYGDEVQYLEDLSGNGNHATQTTLASRPILARVPEGGRRNLFTATNNVAGSPWGGIGASASLETLEVDPNGNTGEVVNVTGSSSFKVWYQFYTVTAATEYTISAWVKSATGSDQTFILYGEGSQVSPNKTATASWQRFEFTFTAATSVPTTHGFADDSGGAAYDILVWGLQLEEGPSATAYQRVVDQYDITEAGVDSLDYLFDDETDDVLSWTAPADTDYTISYVNTSGTVTTLTSQSLSGATDILLDPAIVAYVAVDRALTAGETTNLETYLGALA